MKAEELEDLKIYSNVLNENINTINVLGSLLDAKIREADRCLKSFKRHVDEADALQNTRKNH